MAAGIQRSRRWVYRDWDTAGPDRRGLAAQRAAMVRWWAAACAERLAARCSELRSEPMGAVSSIPINPISWSAGMPAAIPPSNCSANSNRAGTREAIRRVTAYVSRIRQAQGIPPAARAAAQTLPAGAGRPTALPLTPPGRPGWCCGVKPSVRKAEVQQLAQLRAQSAGGRRGHRSGPGILRPWCAQRPARSSSIPGSNGRRPVRWTPCQRFADRAPGRLCGRQAGVTLPWSTGPVEGHINRLKT